MTSLEVMGRPRLPFIVETRAWLKKAKKNGSKNLLASDSLALVLMQNDYPPTMLRQQSRPEKKAAFALDKQHLLMDHKPWNNTQTWWIPLWSKTWLCEISFQRWQPRSKHLSTAWNDFNARSLKPTLLPVIGKAKQITTAPLEERGRTILTLLYLLWRIKVIRTENSYR